MVDVNVNFVLGNDEPLRADFQLEPDVTYTADIKLSEATRDHTKLYNRDEANQHPMSAITGLEDALDTLSGAIDSNHNAITEHVSDKSNPHEVTKAQVGLGNVENLAPADMPVSTATQTALNTKVDKVSTADRVYGTDAQGNQTTYDKGSFGQVDDVKVAGVSVVTNKIANLGSMASETASDYYTSSQVDTALSAKQDNLSAGTGIDITSNEVSVTDPTLVNNGTGTKALAVGKTSQSTAEGGVAVGYGAQANSTYGTAVGYESRASNTNTTVIGKGAKATQARAIAIGSGAEATAQDAIAIKGVNNTANTFQVYTYNMLDMATGLIPDARISANIARASDIPTNYVTTDTAQTITGTKTFHNCAIESDNFITLTSPNAYVRYSGSGVVRSLLRRNSSGTIEVGSSNDPVKIQGSATRPAYNSSDLALYSDVTSGDSALQSQIDALVVASDVFDIVGTYAELQAYDISTVPVNDIIKVLVDSTHDGAATYYRCVENNNVKSWSYIGSEGAYYTKGEADNRFVPQTRTVNSKALSSDITLTASDVGALPSSTVIPTVNNGQLDIQVNGSSVATFTANQSGNTTANIVVPNSATWGNVTGDIADQTDLQDALDEKQDILSGGRYIEIVSDGTMANLPSGCKQVEYITATGTQHLNTLITATNDYEIRAKFRLTELNDSFLYGARQVYGTSSFALHRNYAPFSTDVGRGYVNLGVDSWYNVKQNKNGIYINDLLAHAYSNSLASFTTPNTIRVFAMAQGNNAVYGSTFMKGDFASFEIYNNGVLVCNLVPCIDSNDVACMYDTVNERFLYNSGTGSFTAGAEVVPSNTVNCTLTGGDISTLLGYTPVNPSSLATVATSGDYDDLTNKPTIPTVNDSTITFTQGGVNKGSFTLNQSSGATIALDAGGAGGIQNTATGTDSLTILGNATSYGNSINIGDYSSANGGYAVAIGGQSGDAYYAEASANGTSVGAGAGASSGSVAVGYQAQTGGSDNIAVGRDTYIDSDASSSVAIGNGASVTGEGNTIANSIQLGSGTNSTANSLQVGSYELLNTSTGLIPDARISTNIARVSDIPTTPTVDGVTIDTNSDDELEAIGVIDNNGNAIKTWTGTLAQYNAIATKDPNMLYNITDDMSVPQTILETLYPVGSLYIGKMSTCPLASLIPNSTWTLVASDKVLQGSGTYTAGTSVNAGLPNITGTLERVVTCTSGGSGTAVSKGTGAFSGTPSTAVNKTAPGSGDWWNDTRELSFKASNSNSIYGNSTTVQPPAYVVNIWERTA